MRRLSRRHLLAGLASIPTAAHAALEPITVVAPNVTNAVALTLWNAKVGGHFAAQGLDATIEGSGAGVGALQQLAAGRCHFVRAEAVEMVKAVARQQAPLLAIATEEHASTFVMLSGPDRPVRDARMLRGKRVGVLAVGSTLDNYLDLMLYQAGLPHDAVERQVIGMNAGAFALIGLGRLDAIILAHETAWPLLHPAPGVSASEAIVLPVSRYATIPGRCFQTTRAIADERPQLVVAFLRAMTASVLEMIAGPIEPLVTRCTAAFDMPGLGPLARTVAVVQWEIQTWLAEGRPQLLRNIDAGWQTGMAAMADAGLGSVPPGTKVYTNRFIEQVLP
jgi:NitT/TauT family transport system substrate-binding protein